MVENYIDFCFMILHCRSFLLLLLNVQNEGQRASPGYSSVIRKNIICRNKGKLLSLMKTCWNCYWIWGHCNASSTERKGLVKRRFYLVVKKFVKSSSIEGWDPKICVKNSVVTRLLSEVLVQSNTIFSAG